MQKNPVPIALSFLFLLSLLLGACAPAAPSITETSPPAPTSIPTQTSQPTATQPPQPSATSEPMEEPTAELMVLTDGLGKEYSLEQPFQRVVSLAPSNTEILFAVGAGDQVVGRDAFSDYPEAALQVADIGGGFGEIDTETLIAADPDLVLASELNAPEQIASLENLGLSVFTLPNPNTFDELFDNLRVVAELTGHTEQTKNLIADLRARVDAVETTVSTVEEQPLVFYELDSTDPSAPWTAGDDTFIDTLIAQAGGENLGRVLQGDWAQISLEEIITKDPDVIVLGDYTWGGVTPGDVAARSGWESLSAVVGGQVFTFDDNLVSRPGPRLVEGLEEMARLLHPDLFE